MFAKVVCRTLGHRVNRRRVKFNEGTFTGHCQRCGTAMVREPEGWRPAAGGA